MLATAGDPTQQTDKHLVADQSEVAAFLSRPATHGGAAVERIDTHGAMVFLAGSRAYKVKRAVDYPYMNFSTLARRRRACEREITLNRRSAPELYLDTVAIRRTAEGKLSFGAEGEVIEWAVVMRRFDQEGLFDHLVQAGGLTPERLTRLADKIADFHARAEPVKAQFGDLRWVFEENAAEFAERPELFPPAQVGRLTGATQEVFGKVAGLLYDRRKAGFVRRCHGDLHLRNVCLIDGEPTLFDAIEFNDALACIDVFYDLAFLLMDLDHRGLRAEANLLLNRYLQRRDDPDGLAALPLFLSLRAAVRAKVSVSMAGSQSDPAAARRLEQEAGAYFAEAQAYLAPPAARMIAVGGLSGSGKSTLARALAPEVGPVPGALQLRSDVLRKALFGVDELTPLPAGAYRPDVNQRVYAELLDRAARALRAGHAVVADAVFGQPKERQQASALARAIGVDFTGLWLDAPLVTLSERTARRRGDASDATPDVVERQAARDTGVITWHRLDASGPVEAVVAAARRVLSAAAKP